IVVKTDKTSAIREKAEAANINFRYFINGWIGISLDETTTTSDLSDILSAFANGDDAITFVIEDDKVLSSIPSGLVRTSEFLKHEVFNAHHSESQMMRYIKMLENKDLSLNTSMISLGSCTMKLNAATEMIPVSWTHWSKMHPF